MLNLPLLSAQNNRKLNREGVNAYEDSAYSDAELKFMKALEADTTSMEAIYNIANTLYKQDRFEEAGKIFEELSSTIEEKEYLSDIHHNMGNSFLKNNDYQKSIEAYKNALRLAPGDDETRYNLAYAKTKLQQQQQEQQEQQNQDQNQEEEEQDQNQEEQEQDQQQNQDQEQEQEQEQQDQQNEREQQQENDEKDQQQQQQQAQAMKSLSKEDMERLLQAIQQQEKEVQEKLEKAKAKAPKTKTEKDW
jgi:tetratricopeptide (TPR) repeat protein